MILELIVHLVEQILPFILSFLDSDYFRFQSKRFSKAPESYRPMVSKVESGIVSPGTYRFYPLDYRFVFSQGAVDAIIYGIVEVKYVNYMSLPIRTLLLIAKSCYFSQD